MNVNPNLKNPLALFALCFIVAESVITALLIHRAPNIEICPWETTMLYIFVVAFPLIVFVGFYVLLFTKPEVLFSPLENAYAQLISDMSSKEKQNRPKEKNILYGLSSPTSNDAKIETKSKRIITEDTIIDQYISILAPFLRKNVKVQTKEGMFRFFDAHAYWNGCNYTVEVKCMPQWNSISLQGVKTFVNNARSCFYPIHMTLILYIKDMSSDEKTIAKEIHEVDPAINIIFAYEENENIKFSNIY